MFCFMQRVAFLLFCFMGIVPVASAQTAEVNIPAAHVAQNDSQNAPKDQAEIMRFHVAEVAPQSCDQMPRTISFFATFPLAPNTDPHNTSIYTVDYGDGTKAEMKKSQGVSCLTDGGGGTSTPCEAMWAAPHHSFTIPGVYTAALYKDGTQIATHRFLVFACDLKSSTSMGPSDPAGPTGDVPLTVTFTFTGGTSIDFGDGKSETLCADCTQWSTTPHQIQHTYTTPGYHQMVIKYNDIGMEGAGVSAISGKILSISPTSGPVGTKVTLYGKGFTSAGTVGLMHLSHIDAAVFHIKDFTLASDGTNITFVIPPTFTVKTCGPFSSDGRGGNPVCIESMPQIVPPAAYTVTFDELGFDGRTMATFTVTK